MKEYVHEFAEHWNMVPTPLEKSGGCWLVRAGRNRAKPEYRVGPKMIECYGLHFILEGSLTYETRGLKHELAAGDIFCLWPKELQAYRISRPEKPLRLIWITVDGPQAAELLGGCGLSGEAPIARQAVSREVGVILREWMNKLESGDHDPLSRLSRIYRLFEQLSRKTRANLNGQSWLKQSRDYFDLHYMEPASVEEAARLAGVHRSYFSQQFAKAYGEPPQSYLQRLRMEKAAELLQERGANVSEVAGSVGYAELYPFTRAFKRYFGIPPSQYRNELT